MDLNESDEKEIIWIRLPYFGKRKNYMKKNYTRKLNVKEEVILIPLMLQKIVKVLFPYSTNSKKSES